MEYMEPGRTGLKVSVAGLGCGGGSRLGRAAGASEAESVALVRGAIDLGVNFFDTAEAYGTEAIVGAAIKSGPPTGRSSAACSGTCEASAWTCRTDNRA